MGKIYPLENGGAKAEHIKIFELENRALRSYYEAKTAIFANDVWRLSEVAYLLIGEELELGKSALTKTELTQLEVLKGFRPKVLDTFSQDKPTVSVLDAIDTLFISFEQGTNTTKMRAILYALVIVPFFVPFLQMFNMKRDSYETQKSFVYAVEPYQVASQEVCAGNLVLVGVCFDVA